MLLSSIICTLLAASFFPAVTVAQSSPELGQPLPRWLQDGDSDSEAPPWGKATPNVDVPDTRRTRTYNLTFSNAIGAPDGYSRPLILVNGKFIGPTIEANWGDTIEVTVHNNFSSPAEGLSVHWHGQRQKMTPWMDGVPSVSQCPIPPQGSFTYRFRAEDFGTGWYHSHTGAQLMDGAFGAMVIYGPTSAKYDIDLGPVVVQDWAHIPYGPFIDPLFRLPPSVSPVANNLLNGMHPYNCSLAANGSTCTSDGVKTSKFRFTSGKTHRIRLLNGGGNENQKFSIDGHQLTVIAQDYIPVKPFNVTTLNIGSGQRYDVLVYGSGKPTDSVYMRSNIVTGPLCGVLAVQQPNATAAVYYEKADTRRAPSSQPQSWTYGDCLSVPLASQTPFYPSAPPSKDEPFTQVFNISANTNATGIKKLGVNGVSFYADYNQATLASASLGERSFPANWSVYDFDRNKTVRAVWYNYFFNAHPMHLHGHNFWILAEGMGTWNGSIDPTVDPNNPPLRDTYTMRASSLDGTTPSYVVMEWAQDNPGLWAFHCHVALHNSAGLYINVLERPSDLPAKVVKTYTSRTCDAWDKWSSSNFVDQEDAGV